VLKRECLRPPFISHSLFNHLSWNRVVTRNNHAVTSLRVPDRDKELEFGGNAAGTLTPSSRPSSLVSGQLLYYPTNSAVFEQPVEEKVSRPGVLGPTVTHWFRCPGPQSHTLVPVSWAPQLRTGSGVLGPTVTHWFLCHGAHSYTLVPVSWVPQLRTGSGVLGPTDTLAPVPCVPQFYTRPKGVLVLKIEIRHWV
jgi:hypothetical protein